MEGITPTLAFAALFFGLSGHPQERADSAQVTPQAEQVRTVGYRVWSDVPCADFAGLGLAGYPAVELFAHDAALASTLLGEPGDLAGGDPFEEEARLLLDEPNLAGEETAAGGCGEPDARR